MSESTPEGTRGIDRIDRIFREAREAQRGVLMPFIVGGSPASAPLPELVVALERGGAGVVEIGFPFSDPIADGGVIAQAMHETLETGRTVEALLNDVRSARSRVDLAIVAMVSVSMVRRLAGAKGLRQFMERLAESGFDGVIIPDLPLEESDGYRSAATDAGLAFTLLIAPTTPSERARAIAQASSGFVYLMARTGITGERSDSPDVDNRVQQLRPPTSAPDSLAIPIAVGFGISTSEHVRAVVSSADAAIIGSALVRRLAEADDPVAEAESFCRSMSGGLGSR